MEHAVTCRIIWVMIDGGKKNIWTPFCYGMFQHISSYIYMEIAGCVEAKSFPPVGKILDDKHCVT